MIASISKMWNAENRKKFDAMDISIIGDIALKLYE
jgi:hypothetical protein